MSIRSRAYRLLRRVWRPPERLYRHLHFTGPIKVAVDREAGFHIEHWGHHLENDLFWRGYGDGWEGTSTRLWARLARKAETVLDIGANTGVFALAAKSVNPEAQIYAFEPVERVFAKLRHNIVLNSWDVKAVKMGVSDRTGETILYDLPSKHIYSASIDPLMLDGHPGVFETVIHVTRIDGFFKERPVSAPILAKIDTERHEFQSISGFGPLLREMRPTLLVEVLDAELGERVAGIFEGLDYVFYQIRENVGIERVVRLGEAERNYLICPREIAEAEGFAQGISHASL